jgi:hypothetical protein
VLDNYLYNNADEFFFGERGSDPRPEERT